MPDFKSLFINLFVGIFCSVVILILDHWLKHKYGSDKPRPVITFLSTVLIVIILIVALLLALPNPIEPVLTPAITEEIFPATAIFIPDPSSMPNIESSPTSVPYPTFPPAGFVMVSEKDGMNLHYVPAGPFIMGSDNDDADEKPAHEVTLDAFWIDETEITNRMYTLCVEAGTCQPPSDKSSYKRTSYYDNIQYADYPVIYILWDDAKAYCEWAQRALPSEAQWEKAARGTDGRTYPWGNNAPNTALLNYNRNVSNTTRVGFYSNGESPYGAYDMAGNVWEWVEDWYSDTYYASSPLSNPLGPDSGQSHVRRGGGWNMSDLGVRSANRVGDLFRNLVIGFRCALTP